MSKMYNLNSLIQRENITQINLSMEIGVTQETISAYLNGKAKPSADVLIKLANYFNTNIDYILCRTKYDLPVDSLKPNNIIDEDFVLLNKIHKLSSTNKHKVEAYIDGLTDK